MTTGTLPVLPVADVVKAVEFYTRTLGFKEDFRMPGPDGTIVTGQVDMQGCKVMFNLNPKDAGKKGGGIWLWIRVDEGDIDKYHDALAGKGVKIVEEPKNQFWGDRSFAVEDAGGYVLAFNKALAKTA